MPAVELFRFPHAPGDPIQVLLASATRNLERTGQLPWMVMGATEDERLVVLGAGTEHALLAAVEDALLALPGCAWTALVGQSPLRSGAGWLVHAFVRQRRRDGTWTAWVRPQIDTPQGIAWLDDWQRRQGESLPDGDPLFPVPSAEFVGLVRPAPPPLATWSQDLPASIGAEELVDQLGAFACRWFTSEGTLPPMAVRQVDGSIEGLTLANDALASDLSDVAIRWAQQPETLAVGTCRRRGWPQGGRGAWQLQVVLEVRRGPALVWVRRFQVDGNKARWETPTGRRVVRSEGSARAWMC